MKNITKKQIKEFELVIKNWKAKKSDDAELQKAYQDDRNRLMEILNLIKEGKLVKAGNKANVLDTIVRDLIPADIFDIIIKD